MYVVVPINPSLNAVSRTQRTSARWCWQAWVSTNPWFPIVRMVTQYWALPVLCLLGTLFSKKIFTAFLYSVYVCWLAQRIWRGQSPVQLAANGFGISWAYLTRVGQKELRELRIHTCWTHKTLKPKLLQYLNQNYMSTLYFKKGLRNNFKLR